MNVVLYLLVLSLLLGGLGLAVFLWMLRSGQYDDLEGAANRILFEAAVPGDSGDDLHAGERPGPRHIPRSMPGPSG